MPAISLCDIPRTQLGFLVTPSPSTQRGNLQPATPYTLGAAASSSASLSEMLRASWTPAKLPCFGSASNSHVESLRAPVAGGGAGLGRAGLLGREERYQKDMRTRAGQASFDT